MKTRTTQTPEDRKQNWKGMNWIRQDHLKPHSHGGGNEETNLVTCCHRCNSSRGDRSVRSFCRAVAGYLNHGVTSEEIERHVRNAARRALPMTEARELIARRGSAARVLTEM
jgi:hypothetical protein